MKKTILSLFVIVLTMIVSMSFAQNPEIGAKIAVGNATCAPGQKADFPLTLKDSVDTVSAAILVVGLPGFAEIVQVIPGPSAPPDTKIEVVPITNTSAGKAYKIYAISDKAPFIANGDYAIVTIAVNQNAIAGEYPLAGISASIKKPGNVSPIQIPAEPGKLVVEGSIEPTPTQNPEEPTPTPAEPTPMPNGKINGIVTECTDLTVIIPIPNAEISAMKITENGEPAVPSVSFTTTTNEKGEFAIENMPQGIYIISAKKEGYEAQNKKAYVPAGVPVFVNICLPPIVEPSPTPTGTPEQKFGSLDGHVIACSSTDIVTPLKGVKVYAKTANIALTAGNVPTFTVYTDEAGYYNFKEIPAQSYIVYFYKQGYATNEQKIDVFQNENAVLDVCLTPVNVPTPTPTQIPSQFGALKGMVTDCAAESNAPGIAKVKVVAVYQPIIAEEKQSTTLQFITYTCLNGTYCFEKLPIGTYIVYFVKEGYGDAKIDTIVEPGATKIADICLNAEVPPEPTQTPEPTPVGVGGIHGFAVLPSSDSDTSATPVVDAVITLLRPIATNWNKFSIVADTKTDEKGEFLFENIEAGSYFIKAEKDGLHPSQKKIVVKPNVIKEIILAMHPIPEPTPTQPAPENGSLSGFVGAVASDNEVAPIEAANVYVYPPKWTQDKTLEPIASALTDAEGKYSIPSLTPGPILIVVEAINYEKQVRPSYIKPGAEKYEKFVLKPIAPPPVESYGDLSGIVFNVIPGTNPDDPVTTTILEGAKVEVYKPHNIFPKPPNPEEVVYTDAEGKFLVEGLEIGKYIVKISKETFKSEIRYIMINADQITFIPVALYTAPAPTPTPVEPEKGNIAGRVMESNADGATTQSIAQAMIVCVKNASEAESSSSTTSDGKPLPNIPGIPVKVTYSDSEGYYKLENIPVGEYTIICMAHKYMPYTNKATVIANETIDNPINLVRIQPSDNPGTLKGKVVTAIFDETSTHTKPTFEPVPGTTVTAYLITGEFNDQEPLTPAASAITDDAGTFVFESLQPGRYYVTGEKDGFEKSARMVLIKSDKETKVCLILKPANIEIPEGAEMDIADDDFGSDAEGWNFGTINQGNFAPVGEYSNNMLNITTKTNQGSFGFWQSPTGIINTIPGMIYKITVEVSSNLPDKSKAPIIRLRCNSNDLTQSDEFVITSVGEGALSPSADGIKYTFLFNPRDAGFTYPTADNDSFFSFDVINIDENDEANAVVSIKSIMVDSFLADSLKNKTVVAEHTFASGSEGWVTSGFGGLTAPVFEAKNGALTMTSANNVNTFGNWVGAEDISIEEGKLYEIVFRLSSNQIEGATVPVVRCRLSTYDQQEAIVKTITSVGDGDNSPTVIGKDYSLILKAQPTSTNFGIYLAVDMMNFSADDAADAVIYIENVAINSYDLP